MWEIPTGHFDPNAARTGLRRPATPLEQVLVADSTYDRSKLKRRLYADGLKTPRCEHCGQEETWRGRRMALILDHVNGVGDDHRLENLRILCPNCAATLDTHCGKNLKRERLRAERERSCVVCTRPFVPRRVGQTHCSHACGHRSVAAVAAQVRSRRVERPPIDVLREEIAALGYSAVGRRYGVSDNAIRKWLRGSG